MCSRSGKSERGAGINSSEDMRKGGCLGPASEAYFKCPSQEGPHVGERSESRP